MVGERFQGADSSLDSLIRASVVAAQRVLLEGDGMEMSEEALSDLALRAMRQVRHTTLDMMHTSLLLT
jgi:hypothetical protein